MADPISTETPSPLAVVCWLGDDGARVTSCPLARERAEELARVYAAAFPRDRHWVEEVPWSSPSPRKVPRPA